MPAPCKMYAHCDMSKDAHKTKESLHRVNLMRGRDRNLQRKHKAKRRKAFVYTGYTS